jgi:hypothetical protein
VDLHSTEIPAIIQLVTFFYPWSLLVNDYLLPFPDMLTDSVAISDPFHLLRRSRDRLIRTTLSMGLGHGGSLCSIERVQQIGFLSPIVFLQSRVSKMHDSLPLGLFSPRTLTVILRDNLQTEFMLAPSCLLTVVLTLSTMSRRLRVDLLDPVYIAPSKFATPSIPLFP